MGLHDVPSFMLILVIGVFSLSSYLAWLESYWFCRSFQRASFWFCWLSLLISYFSVSLSFISFILFTLDFICSFPSFLKWKFWLLIIDLPFLIYAFSAVNFLLSTGLLHLTNFKLHFNLAQNFFKFLLKFPLWLMYLELCCLISMHLGISRYLSVFGF